MESIRALAAANSVSSSSIFCKAASYFSCGTPGEQVDNNNTNKIAEMNTLIFSMDVFITNENIVLQ
jgi:hypothetical protein